MTEFQRIILHLDMDSFFASVEIREIQVCQEDRLWSEQIPAKGEGGGW